MFVCLSSPLRVSRFFPLVTCKKNEKGLPLFPPPSPAGILLPLSSPKEGKTVIATETSSIIDRTSFDALVSVLTLVAAEEDRSLHDRGKNSSF